MENTPGPIYDPAFNPIQSNAPIYSFESRKEKKNESPLMQPISTPINVGPGMYEHNFKTLSNKKSEPEVRFNKTAKQALANKMQYLNETYENYSAIGSQLRSKKKNEGHYKFDKGSRGAKTGIFKQDMSMQPPKLQLPHAHY